MAISPGIPELIPNRQPHPRAAKHQAADTHRPVNASATTDIHPVSVLRNSDLKDGALTRGQ